MAKATLKKSERIKQRKLISQIFEKGNSLRKYPFKLVFVKKIRTEKESPLLFAVTVPKRSFKKAVKRNLLKRRIREAYRLEKALISDQIIDSPQQYALMFIYIAREIESYETIQKSVRKLLRALFEFN